MDKVESLVNYLKAYAYGKNNVVTGKTLSSYFGTTPMGIRILVNKARYNGYAICSCKRGYYYAENKTDIQETINQLNGRISKIKDAISGLEKIEVM